MNATHPYTMQPENVILAQRNTLSVNHMKVIFSVIIFVAVTEISMIIFVHFCVAYFHSSFTWSQLFPALAAFGLRPDVACCSIQL